jgi:alkylhydroperoxidase family enzyme
MIPNFANSDSPLFTPREKAAFHFAEMMAGDHKQISQALFDELRQHFSEQEMLELGWRIAIFVGYGRLVYALGLEDVGKLCPLSAVHGEMQRNGE